MVRYLSLGDSFCAGEHRKELVYHGMDSQTVTHLATWFCDLVLEGYKVKYLSEALFGSPTGLTLSAMLAKIMTEIPSDVVLWELTAIIY